jgi:hypothetical protein
VTLVNEWQQITCYGLDAGVQNSLLCEAVSQLVVPAASCDAEYLKKVIPEM